LIKISVDTNSAFVTRGERAVDPGEFEIAECSNARGRDLLAPI
jgi:hypothetical protein